MDFRNLASVYIGESDLSDLYAEHVARTARRVCDYHGADDVPYDYDLFNRWLTSEVKRTSKCSGANYRRMLITLLNYAAERGMCEFPVTRRIKRIKVVNPPPVALRPEQVRRLIEVASTQMRGEYVPGVHRGDYWAAVIIAGYDLGFRRGDIWTLPRSIIDGKPFTIVERKTGRRQCRRLSKEGCERLSKLSQAYQWHRSRTAWRGAVQRLGKLAGIDWTFKQLRRTHGTLAGTLGHADPSVFLRHYKDESLIDEAATGPDPLG